ncbi:hydantoinase B/oxoprolinase family protein [Brevundimonas diminuta]|uniref:Uncharacterized protein n=1 Tax=Brevundimonas diminuta TaxID=293 RepID=A0A2X1AIH3_BREDI|nr:hydantoinase B/oxoprolinase family protein [Brevundimonas diminuta]SPU44287.1 Uncharacterised protein [Brevundimonas diminuta]
MGEPTNIYDKQEAATAREWVRLLREKGPEAVKAAMDAHAERRARLRAQNKRPA